MTTETSTKISNGPLAEVDQTPDVLDRRVAVRVYLDNGDKAEQHDCVQLITEVGSANDVRYLSVVYLVYPTGSTLRHDPYVTAATGQLPFRDWAGRSKQLSAYDRYDETEFNQLRVLLLLVRLAGHLDAMRHDDSQVTDDFRIIARRLGGVIKEIKGHWRKLGLNV
jgi:hypothetical protein